MSTHLPEDVVIGILSRLPVKSLLRFRCVRKSWYALIRNPSFIEKHSNFMKNNDNGSNDERFLVKRCLKVNGKPVVSLLTFTDRNEILDFLDLPVYEEKLYDLVGLGPINGIYVLYGRINGISVVLNPATRDFKALPVSTVPLPPDTTVLTDSVGFGFDPKTSVYKLVRIINICRYDDNEGTGGFISWNDERQHHLAQVEVYTLGTGSWRKIDAVLPNHHIDPPLVNTYLNGFYYWLLIDGMYSFDMGDEVFCKVPLPVRFTDLDFGVLALFNESLALILYCPPEPEKCFDIWVMNKCGEEVSWTKQFTIGPLLGVERMLGFGKNGALFFENGDGRLLLYEPDAQLIKDLRVHGMENSFQVLIYMESLVLTEGGNELKQQYNPFEIIPDPLFPRKPCSGKNQTHSASS